MYINEAISAADKYYPNEYELPEKYLWCDEVSSMLAIEDRRVYKEKRLPIARDGTVLLPENVSIEYIDKVIYKGKELAKQDDRTFGRAITVNGYCVGEGDGDFVTVVYLVPYEPIRLIKYNGDVIINNENNSVKIKSCEFIIGDTLILQSGDTTVTDIPLLDIECDINAEYPYTLICGGGYLDELSDENSNCIITRYVTDKTVCDAPFDGMYVDYLLAKINMHQRDIPAYNQHITAFNSRLNAYKKWVNEHSPKDEGKIINWW